MSDSSFHKYSLSKCVLGTEQRLGLMLTLRMFWRQVKLEEPQNHLFSLEPIEPRWGTIQHQLRLSNQNSSMNGHPFFSKQQIG